LNIIFVILLNVGIGFSGLLPVDNSAHIGGLLAGGAMGYVLCPRYALGDWFNPFVRNLSNTNKGPLTWVAAALLGLAVVLAFFVLLLLFQAGILKPTYLIQ
jgi:polyferredoxin